jgi:hypothetical protein
MPTSFFTGWRGKAASQDDSLISPCRCWLCARGLVFQNGFAGWHQSVARRGHFQHRVGIRISGPMVLPSRQFANVCQRSRLCSRDRLFFVGQLLPFLHDLPIWPSPEPFRSPSGADMTPRKRPRTGGSVCRRGGVPHIHWAYRCESENGGQADGIRAGLRVRTWRASPIFFERKYSW